MNNFNNIIVRNGYGSNFNILYYNDNKTLIKKKAINNFAISKLKNEINFYNFIKINNINFNIPIIYNYDDDFLIINFINNTNNNNKNFNINIINKIFYYLNNLHNYSFKSIDKKLYLKLLFEETIFKIKDRIKEIEHIINNYKNIKINNFSILTFDEIILKLENKLKFFTNNLNQYNLNIIHGDPQFNNIIINNDNEIFFIDPKGNFGTSNIYGIKEYDIAKIYLSLSGYNYFDDMIFNSFNIINNNIDIEFINIPDFNIHKNNYNKELIIYLFISIWLSNAHIFINQPNKVLYSYFIGLYFASKLL